MDKIQYQGNVGEDGVLKIVHRAKFDQDLKHFAGKSVVITLERKKKKRTLSQNSYYWVAIVPGVQEAMRELGHSYSLEMVHDILRMKFLQVDDPLESGEFITRIKSTTELSTMEFQDYITEVAVWTQEFLNVTLPLPGRNL